MVISFLLYLTACLATTLQAADNSGTHLRIRPHAEPLQLSNGTVALTNGTTTISHRRIQQVRTVLVFRVINGGIGPSVSASTIRQYTFTDTNSLKAQMMRCSANALLLTESRYGSVRDLYVDTAMHADALKVAVHTAASALLGDLRSAADHIMFIFPKISNYLAEAETGYSLSYYNDDMGVSLGVVAHEIGHNLGMCVSSTFFRKLTIHFLY